MIVSRWSLSPVFIGAGSAKAGVGMTERKIKCRTSSHLLRPALRNKKYFLFW